MNSPHHHAEVRSLNNYCDAKRVQGLLNDITDLGSQPLLHLQPPAIGINYPCNLAQACDPTIGDIGDMGLAKKR